MLGRIVVRLPPANGSGKGGFSIWSLFTLGGVNRALPWMLGSPPHSRPRAMRYEVIARAWQSHALWCLVETSRPELRRAPG